MKKELLFALIGGVGTVSGTVIGFVLSEISAMIKRKNDKKERFLMSNYAQRQTAYERMYRALNEYKSYFDKFIQYDNEFTEHEEKSDFAPLEQITELRYLLGQNEMWLHTKTVKKIDDVIVKSSHGCNLAINLTTEEDEMFISAVEPMAEDIMNGIEDVMAHMKEIIGMLLLDKYQDKMTR